MALRWVGDSPLHDGVRINELNNHCIHLILKNITSFPDQLRTARACRRFQTYFHGVWKQEATYRTTCMISLFAYVSDNNDKMFYLETMHLDIDMIRFTNFCLSHVIRNWRALGIMSFPNCHTFEISGPFSQSDGDIDETDIFLLYEYVPNIKCLRLNTYTNAVFIPRFQYLEECHLCIDRSVDKYRTNMMHLNANDLLTELQYLRVLDIRPYRINDINGEILSKCVRLETLKLHYDTFMPLKMHILNLPRLAKLSVYLNPTFTSHIRPPEMYDVLNEKAETVIGIRIENTRVKLLEGWDNNLRLLQFKKLQSFSFTDWEGNQGIVEKYLQMTELTVLRFNRWLQLDNDMVLKFVKACKKLRHLEITLCPLLTESLLYAIAKILKKKKRTLYVYYDSSGLADAVELKKEFWTQQKYLQVIRSTYQSHNYPREFFNALYRGMEFEFEVQPDK